VCTDPGLTLSSGGGWGGGWSGCGSPVQSVVFCRGLWIYSWARWSGAGGWGVVPGGGRLGLAVPRWALWACVGVWLGAWGVPGVPRGAVEGNRGGGLRLGRGVGWGGGVCRGMEA